MAADDLLSPEPELTDADEATLRREGWSPSPVRDGWWRDGASGEDYPASRALRLARRDATHRQPNAIDPIHVEASNFGPLFHLLTARAG